MDTRHSAGEGLAVVLRRQREETIIFPGLDTLMDIRTVALVCHYDLSYEKSKRNIIVMRGE